MGSGVKLQIYYFTLIDTRLILSVFTFILGEQCSTYSPEYTKSPKFRTIQQDNSKCAVQGIFWLTSDWSSLTSHIERVLN